MNHFHFTGILSNCCLLIIAALTVTSVHGSFSPKSFLDPKTLINPTTVNAALEIAAGKDPKLVAAQTGMQMAAQTLQNQNANANTNGQQAGQVPQVPPYQQQQSSNQVVSQPPLLNNNPYDQQQQQQFNQTPVGPQSTQYNGVQSTQYNGVQSTQYNGQVSNGQTLPPPYPGQNPIPGYTYPPSSSGSAQPPPAYTGYGNVPPPTPVGYTNVTPGQNQGFNTQPQGFNQHGFYNGQAQPQQYGRVY